MIGSDLEGLLEGKDEQTRSDLAGRVGQGLCSESLSDVEQIATEALARELANDAVERVRIELSKAIRHARFLPKDIAHKIAHDIDSVATPFLEVTEVFSDSDWRQLVRTISEGALVAVARRSSMNEDLALTLAELGSSEVVETLIENPASPMTAPVCETVMDRFAQESSVLDKLAQRDDLLLEIAVKLTAKVSEAARDKLVRSYNLPDFTEPLGIEAEAATHVELIRGTPVPLLPALLQSLKDDGKLTYLLLLTAARENLLPFVEITLAHLSAVPPKEVRFVLQGVAEKPLTKLLRQAQVPPTMLDDFVKALIASPNHDKPERTPA